MRDATTKCALALALVGLLAIGPALAEKGGKSDHGRADKQDNQKGARGDSDGRSARGNSGHSESAKSGRNERADRPDNQNSARGNSGRANSGQAAARRDHFDDRHRVFANNYYTEQFRTGRCPPGLAKKHNGCMPPGQAKKWNVGQSLPQGVVYYSVPQPLVLQFGQPPSGYRYVRVGSDILLMAIGTRMIVDSLQNLGRS